MKRWLSLACAGAVLVLAVPTAAQAQSWRPVARSCVGATGTGGCTAIRAAGGLWHIAVAPGARTAYGIAHDQGAVLIFDRDPATGALKQRGAGGCISEDTTGGQCVGGRGLAGPRSVLVSPDGRHVYVGSDNPGGIALFDRDPATGDLTQKAGIAGCITRDGSSAGRAGVCQTGRGITATGVLALSPDGRTLYAGRTGLAVFHRNPTTGVLTQPAGAAACIEETAVDGCVDGRGFSLTRQLAITPDGRSIYMAGAAGSLTLVDRDPVSGLITQKAGRAGCLSVDGTGGECTVEPRLTGAIAAVSSPNGGQVYVSIADGLLVFARAPNGSLKFQSCVNATGTGGCAAGKMLREVSYTAISPDGQTLVASLTIDAGIVAFVRDAAGNLSQLPGQDGCVTTNGAALVAGATVSGACHAYAGVPMRGQITFAGDGQFYAGGYVTQSMAAFKRDFYPTCAAVAVSVTQNTSTPVGLSCADRNGDPAVIEITRNPVSGVLGAVDQGASRVFYNPFSGYLGGDGFGYRAVAAGLASAEAPVAVTVAAAPPPVRRITTINAPVSYGWTVRGTRLTLKQLRVRSLRAGSRVEIVCAGKRCPFRTVRVARKSSATIDLLKALKRKRSFRAGQTLEVRVITPGYHTRVVRFRLKRAKLPVPTRHCIRVGEKRVRNTC